MMESLLSPTLLLLIFFLLCITTSGQLSAPAQAPSGSTTTAGHSSPPAPSPSGPLAPSASSSPADIVAILRKARKFSTFIGLLKSTQMDAEINSELKKKSNAGFTIFAPTDSAFSDLKTGTLNSFTDNQKAALTKFHIINSFLTISQFQTLWHGMNCTVSNPLCTNYGIHWSGCCCSITLMHMNWVVDWWMSMVWCCVQCACVVTIFA